MADRLSVGEVNALDEAAFIAAFGHVYEDTPALATVAWSDRPFADRDTVRAAFADAARSLDADAVLALLRSHPALAVGGAMAAASRSEQRGAGLTATDDPLLDEIRAGNAAYEARFGFPFIIAVRGLGPRDVADALTERLGHDAEEERAAALEQVIRIAGFRVDDVVAP